MATQKVDRDFRLCAPEVINFDVYSTEADVWAYGIILWQLFKLGEIPFRHIQAELLYEELNKGTRPLTNTLPQPVQSLLEECWRFQRKKRISWKAIVDKLDEIIAA